MKSLSIFLMIAISCIAATEAATFNVTNRCLYPVWPAAVPGGGARLNTNESWTFDVSSGTISARIWGRTNCTFDRLGRGKCLTGDCNGVLNCTSNGTPPNTLVEFALNQYNNLDFYDITLVDGFNLPIQFNPISNGCNRTVTCDADINGQCPAQLKVPGGCNNPCTVFKTDEYCCTSRTDSCEPTNYSRFFKNLCPDAYSYPKDDVTSMFTCPGDTNYTVVFCPST